VFVALAARLTLSFSPSPVRADNKGKLDINSGQKYNKFCILLPAIPENKGYIP
jgi:hypothetical protein